MDSAPQSVAGRYTIERELGRGATATVYLAKDQRTGKLVAIKLLKRELAESIGAERFLREISLTGKLHHPHILPVLDSGQYERRLYFVLPLMKDGTLRERMRRERQLPIDAAVAIAKTVADALEYAHGQGFIHRDVKPDNILFSGDDVCLADFGIARAIERSIDESSTTTGIVRGTPAYMSPEQASGEHDYDGRSDIYSLACVLYEMIAGMPVFVGPTQKSVMAQRLLHPPRAVSVYRPNIPSALEATLNKALQITPADRYQTAAAFSRALSGDQSETPIARSEPPIGIWRSNRGRILSGAGIAVASIALATFKPWPGSLGMSAARADTSRIVVLPLEGDAGAPTSRAYDMLQQGLSRWDGVNVVDRFAMRDARGSERPVSDDDEARETALAAGAGRYVRARITRDGSNLALWSGLYDVNSRTRLYEKTIRLPGDLKDADSSVALLTDELMLRRSGAASAGSRVLPAVQLLDTAMRAIYAFSLVQADSLLLASLEADPGYARAALWLAQVRNWKLEPRTSWSTWAERANAGKGLTSREARFARALVAMGKEDYASACAAYDSSRALDERDFASWYGLGQCHRLDAVVVRDRRSASGWRFRSSSHRAATAYARAFELAPALHQSFESRAYTKLRDLLYSSRSMLRPGVAIKPDTGRFFGYASWTGDSLVHVPYPADMVSRGQVVTDPRARDLALNKQREVFQRIAQSWAAALPASPGTKEALAISLESVGDVRAIDTLRLGRSLARTSELRTRLAAEEVFMRVAFGRRDPAHLPKALALADSLLGGRGEMPREEAAILAPVAAVTGRCHLAARLAARSVSDAHAVQMEQPLTVVAAAESLTVLSAMGCRSPADSLAARSLVSSASGERRDTLEYKLLNRAVALTYPLDIPRVVRLIGPSGDYVLEIQAAAAKGDVPSVRSVLDVKLRRRSPADVTPDAAYPEARVWLQLRDAKRARATLDPILLRTGWLELMLNDPINAASLMRSIALRADLAAREGDTRTASQWARMLAVLWARADPEILPIARRMSAKPGTR